MGNGNGDGGAELGDGGRVGQVQGESRDQQARAPDQLSGKEIDLFYRSPNGHVRGNVNGNGVNGNTVNDGDHRARNGFGGGGRGRTGGAGMGMDQRPRVHGEDVLARDRTSYVFCPEAHGMMRWVVRVGRACLA